jgi:hypothetical protein
LRYDLHNGLQHVLARSHDGSFLRYRYEDVVTEPASALRRLAAFCGSPDPDLGFLTDDAARLGENHLVDGNPVRFHHGELRLRPDLAWQTALSPRRVRTVTALTLPFLRSYDYRVTRPTTTGADRSAG